MKSLFTAIFKLFTAFFALFTRRSRHDGKAIDEKQETMYPNFEPDLRYQPAQSLFKCKRPFNNRKRTRGRRFYYNQFGKKQLIAR